MKILNLKDSDFEDTVIKQKKLFLCDFWAEWCGPCKQLTPILEELSVELQQSGVTIAKVNIDENPETPSKYGIMSIPTLLLFKEGKLVSTQVGVLDKDNLKEWVNSNI